MSSVSDDLMIQTVDEEKIQQMVAQSLNEDIGTGDITAELLPEQKQVKASVMVKEDAMICGIDWVNETYRQLDPRVQLQWDVDDGDVVESGDVILTLSGACRSIVTGERCALNWLQTLSGTATAAALYVDELEDTPTQLLDTRKTIPGLRLAQKYAVAVGGGTNHRMGLYDAFLIKENHIMSCGSIANAVAKARELYPTKPVEVEVETLNELEQALEANADIIMLDNFSLKDMCEAAVINRGRAKLEASGNVELDNIREIAETGVDFISVGAITKNLFAIDLSMRIIDWGQS